MEARQIVFVSKGTVALKSVEVEAPLAGEVRVEMLYSTISPGTELAFLHQAPNTTSDFPMFAGYTACARVVDCGPDVGGFQPRQLLAVQGPHASHARLSESVCWKIPASLDAKEAAAFRIVSIALQGVRKAEIRLGHSVAVLGLGVVGNLAGQIARAAGATRVVGIDPVAERRTLAKSCGFDAVYAAAEEMGGETFEVVIEASGVPEAITNALTLAPRLGRVIILGSTRGTTKEVNFYRDVHKKGLTIIGAHDGIRAAVEDVGFLATHHSDGQTSLDLMAAGRVKVGPLISDTVGPDQAVEAYQRLSRREEPLTTVAIRWADD